MGQKVHPIGFRLALNHHHSHVACVPNRLGPQVYLENYLIRQWLQERCVWPSRKDLYSTELTRIKICRMPQEINPQKEKKDLIFIDVWTGTPKRVLLLSPKYGLDELRQKPVKLQLAYAFKSLESYLLKRLLNVRPKDAPFLTVRVGVVRTRHLTIASLISQKMAYYLQRRDKFRIWFRKACVEIQEDNDRFKMTAWLGLRIDVSGRINGAEMARTETLRLKSLPCQTMRAPVEYHISHANTKYGLLGVKVWTYIDPKTSVPKEELYMLPLTQRFGILSDYNPEHKIWFHRSNYERSYILNEMEWLRPYLLARAKKKSYQHEKLRLEEKKRLEEKPQGEEKKRSKTDRAQKPKKRGGQGGKKSPARKARGLSAG